jgi:hypothetical protein
MLLFVVLLGFDLVGVVSLCKKRNGEMVTAVIAFCNDMLVGHGEGNVVIVGQGEEIPMVRDFLLRMSRGESGNATFEVEKKRFSDGKCRTVVAWKIDKLTCKKLMCQGHKLFLQ